MKQSIIILALLLAQMQAFALRNQTFPERKGFVISAMAGVGTISLSGNAANTSGGFDISLPNVKVGSMVGQRTALLLNMPGMQYRENGKDRSMDALVPSIQYWVKPNWWVNGGAGLSMDTQSIFEKITLIRINLMSVPLL